MREQIKEGKGIGNEVYYHTRLSVFPLLCVPAT